YLKKAELGDDLGPSVQRDRLLSGLRYLLVDEYQDINSEHYELISALAGRTVNNEEDKLSIMAVGDDDQNIYAFGGASVRFIKQFSLDYQAKTYYLIENYRSTAHIIHCANRVIAVARDRMKTEQTLRINYARKDLPDGGEWASLDSLTQGRVLILETPAHVYAEVKAAMAELMRLNQLLTGNETGHWGQFAVIARHWEALEPISMLCRQSGIPVRLMRDEYLLDLHSTREGNALISLLNNQRGRACRSRVLIRWGALSRWFRRRYRQNVRESIEHPYRAMLAQFITEAESVAPDRQHVVSNLLESIYEFRSGSQSVNNHVNSPLLLLTAHRAKGLEFDHVLVLDAGGWQNASDEERRLFYVAMTRARKTLTLCARQESPHAFIRDCDPLCLKSRPQLDREIQPLVERVWAASPAHVVLSWPGYYSADNPIHRAIAELDYGSELTLRNRSDGKPGWELTNEKGAVVSRMAQSFAPPKGGIISVKAGAILTRFKKPSDSDALRKDYWEVVLPEILYLPSR
ncbi:MAG: 3'-5' exonuclease, partial [Methylobacter sp.]